MEISTERVERLGPLAWYGYSRYVQEIKREKLSTVEKVEVYVHDAAEMPDGCGQRINYLV